PGAPARGPGSRQDARRHRRAAGRAPAGSDSSRREAVELLSRGGRPRESRRLRAGQVARAERAADEDRVVSRYAVLRLAGADSCRAGRLAHGHLLRVGDILLPADRQGAVSGERCGGDAGADGDRGGAVGAPAAPGRAGRPGPHPPPRARTRSRQTLAGFRIVPRGSGLDGAWAIDLGRRPPPLGSRRPGYADRARRRLAPRMERLASVSAHADDTATRGAESAHQPCSYVADRRRVLRVAGLIASRHTRQSAEPASGPHPAWA